MIMQVSQDYQVWVDVPPQMKSVQNQYHFPFLPIWITQIVEGRLKYKFKFGLKITQLCADIGPKQHIYQISIF